jgi:hypothetical protein
MVKSTHILSLPSSTHAIISVSRHHCSYPAIRVRHFKAPQTWSAGMASPMSEKEAIRWARQGEPKEKESSFLSRH